MTKSADSSKQERQAGAVGSGAPQKGHQAQARPWGTANKLPGGGGKVDARRQLPSGPLGGSGRKTNRSRSS